MVVVLPVAWVILMSIKSIPDAYTGDLFPRQYDFTHYRYVFEKMPNVLRNFSNSIIVTFSTVVVTCTVAVLAGYALVHLRLPGKVLGPSPVAGQGSCGKLAGGHAFLSHAYRLAHRHLGDSE